MAPDKAITVLVVDDNELVGQSMARCCAVPGIEVVAVVDTAAAALQAAQAHQLDVVLLDYRLGPDSGVMVARQILGLQPTTKVVMVSGAASPHLKREALEAGCVGCIDKTMQVGRMLPDLVKRASSGALA